MTSPRAWYRHWLLWGAVLAALAGYAWITGAAFYPRHWSMDLYHPWGVGMARESLGAGTNPYVDTVRYGAFLDAAARATPDWNLQWVREFWQSRTAAGLEPTGTPLYYAVSSVAPRDFGSFHLLLTIASYAAAAGAACLLAWLRGAPLVAALCAGALVVGTFNPFFEDIKVGNVGSLQLLALAVFVGIAQWRPWERGALAGRGYLAALALFLALKPNSLFVAAGLAAHYAAARGARRFVACAAVAAAVVIAAAAGAAWYFGSAGVWLDWLRYVNGLNGGTLLYALRKGNVSLPVLLHEHGGAYGPQAYALILGIGFVVALLACASAVGREPARILPAMRAWLRDPWAAASIGTLAMFTASPLLWPHYLLFALLPIAWLARPARPRDWTAACALASFLLFSTLVLNPLVYAGLKDLAYSVTSLAWLPLLPALFSRLARMARATAPHD